MQCLIHFHEHYILFTFTYTGAMSSYKCTTAASTSPNIVLTGCFGIERELKECRIDDERASCPQRSGCGGKRRQAFLTCLPGAQLIINTLKFYLCVRDGCGRGHNEFAGRVQNYHVRSSCQKWL